MGKQTQTKPKVLGVLLVCILCLALLSACESSANKYDQAARKAAETVVSNEVSDYTWTTVETGDLEYQYTVYNEETDKYKVCYFIKFDAKDEPEDEYLNIGIILVGDELLVADTDVSYMRAEDYLANTAISVGQINDKDGKWLPIN